MKRPKIKITCTSGEPKSIHNKEMVVTNIIWNNNLLQSVSGKLADNAEEIEFTFFNNGADEFWHRHGDKIKAEFIDN